MRGAWLVGAMLLVSPTLDVSRAEDSASSVAASGVCRSGRPCPLLHQSRDDSLVPPSGSFSGCAGPFLFGNGRAVVYGNNSVHNPTACINFTASSGVAGATLTTNVRVVPTVVLPALDVGLEGGTIDFGMSLAPGAGSHLTIASACVHTLGLRSTEDLCTPALSV
jgi:hypothetical protein